MPKNCFSILRLTGIAPTLHLAEKPNEWFLSEEGRRWSVDVLRRRKKIEGVEHFEKVPISQREKGNAILFRHQGVLCFGVLMSKEVVALPSKDYTSTRLCKYDDIAANVKRIYKVWRSH